MKLTALKMKPKKDTLKASDPNCACASALTDTFTCSSCNGTPPRVLKLIQEKQFMHQELANTKLKIDKLKNDSATKNIENLREIINNKDEELYKLKQDMELLGQRLLLEIEKRDELQQQKDNTTQELEELTQSLFEEANSMVANEARERHGAQERVGLIEKQLAETNLYLQMEKKSTANLRIRLSKLEQEHDELLNTTKDSSRNSNTSLELKPKPDSEKTKDINDYIDPHLFAHFAELVEQAPGLKPSKLHNLLYMRNALEDDVTPCLRFGGNPRTSTKKFIDAIIANTCFIEEMNSDQIQELIQRDEKSIQDSTVSEPMTPTVGLFNKTVFERITTAWTPTPVLGKSGCSTCARDEPYKYRFKISDVQHDIWYPICTTCRTRLMAVIEFYGFVRGLRQGLYNSRKLESLYIEQLGIKRNMFYTRFGCHGLDLEMEELALCFDNDAGATASTPTFDRKISD